MKVFVKSRRAKDKDDYETWVEHGIANTLNTFEGGDVRATTLIVKDEDNIDRQMESSIL